ncbi:MAG: hypothetical protein P8X94_08350 [Woeseiaceae bacterium]
MQATIRHFLGIESAGGIVLMAAAVAALFAFANAGIDLGSLLSAIVGCLVLYFTLPAHGD